MKVMTFAVDLRNHVVVEDGSQHDEDYWREHALHNLEGKLRRINCSEKNNLRFDPDKIKLETEIEKIGTKEKLILQSTTQIVVVVKQRDQKSYTNDEVERDQDAIKRVLMEQRIRMTHIFFMGSIDIENAFTDHPEEDYRN